MSPAVSVIVPTFNREHFLGVALESVRAQTFRDLEVIVVDDGSTDGTRVMLEELAETDPRFRYHHQRNRGVASARNAGLDLATGAYVAFLDSDDAWRPWHLELMLASLSRLPEAGFVWTDLDAVDRAGTVTAERALRSTLSAYDSFSNDELFASSLPLSELGVEIPTGDRDRRLYLGDVYSPMVMGNLVMPSSVLMRRARLDETGRFDEHLATGEDYEFFLRACRAGPVAFADIADIAYRVGPADRLSGPRMGLQIAHAYLDVLERTLAHDADRITLSEAMIAKARGFANLWIGETELLVGRPVVARKHLATAFRLGRRRAWTLALWIASFLPHSVVTRMAGLRRRWRGRTGA